MGKQTHEVVISTNRINCYGSRVLTNGIDISQYQRNPVLLYMHTRYDMPPIGRVENIRKEDDQLLGSLFFDMDDAESARIANKWDNGFLKMVSASLDVIETSTEIEDGQAVRTVTKSKLIEVSVVDIGGNDDALAVQLSYEGKIIELSRPEDFPNTNTNTNSQNMKELLELLNLPTDASDKEVLSAVTTLQKQNKELIEESNRVKSAQIKSCVELAIQDGKIEESARAHFEKMGENAGYEMLQSTLSLIKTMKPTHQATRPSMLLKQPTIMGDTAATWDAMDKEGTLFKLKSEDPERYNTLYMLKFNKK